MAARHDEVESTFELPDGTEAGAVLRYSVTPYRYETRWEPAEGGIEIEGLSIAGVDVDHAAPQYAQLLDELTARAWAYSRSLAEEEE